MKGSMSSRNKLIALIAAMTMAIGAAIPLMAMSQSSPEASPAANDQIAQGEKIYNTVCMACHQPDGNGIEGIYLPLNNNPLVTLEDPTYVITTVLHGRGGMPQFQGSFDDEQIAAVISYVRQNWDNDAAPVTAEQVKEVRDSTEGKDKDSTPTPEAQEQTGQNGMEGSATPEATP